MSLEQTNGKTHIYIYIYIYIYTYILYVYVSNQIQQNKMQPEHVSEANANDPLTLTGKPNPLRSRAHIKCLQ